MTAQEFATYQEQTFDSYAKRLIRNEGADARRELKRQSQREVQLSALLSMELPALAKEDKYNLENISLCAREDEVTVTDAMLGQALSFLQPQWREVLLLYYFLGESDAQIGARIDMTQSGVHHRRMVALARLRNELEALGYGE